ncbi:hypothetical protein B0H16DRAFT_1741260 [Mycena metata]|uniref:Uncharacterized protein n=1 Tax=Mycena metata TaxID=1033252 RepID=A0AAD7HAS0_9AGAR|nr:hypothetical protein B0H16DRAFT_1741260 [Mycena metata]
MAKKLNQRKKGKTPANVRFPALRRASESASPPSPTLSARTETPEVEIIEMTPGAPLQTVEHEATSVEELRWSPSQRNYIIDPIERFLPTVDPSDPTAVLVQQLFAVVPDAASILYDHIHPSMNVDTGPPVGEETTITGQLGVEGASASVSGLAAPVNDEVEITHHEVVAPAYGSLPMAPAPTDDECTYPLTNTTGTDIFRPASTERDHEAEDDMPDLILVPSDDTSDSGSDNGDIDSAAFVSAHLLCRDLSTSGGYHNNVLDFRGGNHTDSRDGPANTSTMFVVMRRSR